MKLLIDNALSPIVAQHLRAAGHEAVHVRDVGLARSTDEVIFEYAAVEGLIIVSADTDFATLLALRTAPRPSVVLLRRLAGRRPDRQAALLVANLPSLAIALQAGAVVVLEDGRIRIRALPMAGGDTA